MTEEKDLIYCSHCKEKVAWHVQQVNHKQHFLLTLFTLSLWAPIWLAMTVIKTKCCDKCSNILYEE